MNTDTLRGIIKQKLNSDYMLVEFEQISVEEYEIRKSLLKELLAEIEVERLYDRKKKKI